MSVAVQHMQHLKKTQNELLEEVERLVQENENLKRYDLKKAQTRAKKSCRTGKILKMRHCIRIVGSSMVCFSDRPWKKCTLSDLDLEAFYT